MASILVVDDEGQIRFILKRVLEDVGHEVRLASNGNEAIISHNQQPADLILTDLMMPEMEGLETIMELRRKLRSKVKIIAMSGGASTNLVGARMLGADAVIAKPFDISELLQTVQDMLERD
jgi:DNA-binding response OmpR family regulator